MANEDPRYLDWIRRLPCARCGAPGSQAHHSTIGRGMAQRSHDHEAMPLCHGCHHDLHAHGLGFPRARLQAWQEEQVTRCRARWAAEGRKDFEKTEVGDEF